MDTRLFGYINWSLLALMILLYLMGVVNLYSASSTRLDSGMTFSGFYQRQLVWGIFGLCGMAAAMSFDYRRLRNLAWPLFIVAIVLLALVPMTGKTVYGAKRWLSLGFMNIQPSEVAKLAVVLITARILARGKNPLGWKDFFNVIVVAILPCSLIILQPDLGTTLMILLILAGMILFHGLRGYVFKTCLLLAPCAAAFMWFVGMHDYQRQRILTFLNPVNDRRGAGYHIIQSHIAVGSGQLWGKGFMEGSQSQLRFLPERHSDFAVAVFGEEWGFVGCLVLISLFCLFLLAIFSTASLAKDRFGSLLVVGVFFYFFWQIFINISMVIGLMPVVGIPLPFISYGGSATIVNFTLIGIVLNVSMRRFMFKG
ncbi:MAG: rod shape-determining protein RodA [Desulfovibrio sp.]|jgi:rod shape determining protein RodA|nr:rod shape-determining protein RodA [Desulfovibrio sp.]